MNKFLDYISLLIVVSVVLYLGHLGIDTIAWFNQPHANTYMPMQIFFGFVADIAVFTLTVGLALNRVIFRWMVK